MTYKILVVFRMFALGSAPKMTKSATLPLEIVPYECCMPRAVAPLRLAAVIASSGVKPHFETRSSSSVWMLGKSWLSGCSEKSVPATIGMPSSCARLVMPYVQLST